MAHNREPADDVRAARTIVVHGGSHVTVGVSLSEKGFCHGPAVDLVLAQLVDVHGAVSSVIEAETRGPTNKVDDTLVVDLYVREKEQPAGCAAVCSHGAQQLAHTQRNEPTVTGIAANGSRLT